MTYVPREQGYGKLKVLWLEPKVQFNGKGIITALGEEMERQGWEIIKDKARVAECDLIFFGSDSQLDKEMLAAGKPTVLYFWGWWPARMLNAGFQNHALNQIQLMTRCTRRLVPTWPVMDQMADFGLPSEICRPGIDLKGLQAGLKTGKPAWESGGLPRVMLISRLAEHKAIEVLIEALSVLDPKPETIICGPGDRKPYKDLAESLKVPVRFLGLDDADKAATLANASVLVHPSVYEGFGMPPCEALALGTPAIVFDTPQMRHLLQESASYFTSVDGLAGTIASVCSPEAEAQHRIQEQLRQGWQMISNTLTLEGFAERLWAVFHQAIKEHLAGQLRKNPNKWPEVYDAEHRRNYAYSINRFDPTWERHWRAQAYIDALKQCKAKYVLDIGCGPVYPTILARAGFEVTALDISSECLRQVEEVAAKWGVADHVTTLQRDAQALALLPFSSKSFDAVIQGEIWEHIPDLEAVIRGGLGVLRPGGYLIASTPVGDHHFDPMHIRQFDDKAMDQIISRFTKQLGLAKLVSLSKIAEGGADPSCYLVVLEKV